MLRKLLEFLGFVGSKTPEVILLERSSCRTIDGVLLSQVLAPRYQSRILTKLTLLSLLCVGLSARAEIQVNFKNVKDATHIEFSGSNEWRYEVNKTKVGSKNHVVVQFKDIKPSDLLSLQALRDSRVLKTEVRAGTDGFAEVEFTLSSEKMSFFEYQTESPVNLVFDIYKDEGPKAKKIAKSRAKPADPLEAYVGPVKKEKKSSRSIASTDRPISVGSSPNDDKSLQLKYGVFDGGDQNFERFKVTEKEISEAALIKSEQNIYLKFPELIVERNYLKNILANQPKYEIEAEENEENQQARLITRLFNEDKPAVVLRTFKFFREKFPTSKYDKTLEYIFADNYYKLWLRDHKRADLDAALTKYKTLLNKYPTDSERFRLLMLVGLSYLEIGNSFGALSVFQVGIKNYPDSPYFWQMKMAAAEALRSLNKQSDALKEFELIENDPRSADLGVEARFRRGDVFFSSRDYATAIKEYAEAKKRYPTKWADGPNVFFNMAEAQFWNKNLRESLESYREFLFRFPSHHYGGYAMTRIGEILEILGAPSEKVNGAYLEANFRYKTSPGAYLAQLHLSAQKFATMKERELEAFQKEAWGDMPKDIEGLPPFLILLESDGYVARNEHDKSIDKLIKYYQNNTTSPHLPIFKNRIVDALTKQIDFYNGKGDYLRALQVFIKNSESWLHRNPRIDTKFFAAQAYEVLNVPDEAIKLYQSCLKERSGLSEERLKTAKVFEKLPTEETLHLRIAKAYFDRGDNKKSNDHLNAIKNMEGLTEKEKVERTMIMAAVAEKEQSFDVAIESLKKLIATWNGNVELLAEPWLRLARVNQRLKKYDESDGWIEKVLSSAKSEKVNKSLVREALEMRAQNKLTIKKPMEAAEAYRELIDKYSDGISTSSYRYKLGKIYFDQQNVRKAQEVWAPLKDDAAAPLWNKMATENMAQAEWGEKYKRYVDRKPAGGEAK